MLKLLVKKQLLEIFRSYFYDAKKNKQRSRLTVALFFVMYLILMVGILGGMFWYLASTLCKPFLAAGMGWLYFLMMGMLAIALGVFGSVFNTYSGLYLSKDNDLLLSLPIPVKDIMVSRLLSVYLMGLMYSVVVIVPAVIVYWVTAPIHGLEIIGSIDLILLVSLIVLILSCALGWCVAKISLKLKNKSFITVIVSLVFIGLYYFLYFKAQELIQQLLANATCYGEKVKGAAYPLYVFGKVGEGDLLSMFLVTLSVLVILGLLFVVISRSFLHIATATGKATKAVYKERTAKVKSISVALLFKEWKRFSSSANYMLNCGLGTLLLPVGGVVLLVKGKSILEVMESLELPYDGLLAVIFCTIFCSLIAMNNPVVPSVSLEGKNIWILQSLPVRSWEILKAKLQLQLLLTGIPVLFCLICMAVIFHDSWLQLVLSIVLVLCYTFFSAVFGLFLGLKMPNLTWTNETAPIKQSLNAVIALFGGWAYAILFCVVFLTCGYKIGVLWYLFFVIAITASAAILLFMWLKKRGTVIFEQLH